MLRRAQLLLQCLPLLGGIALRSPSMDSSDLRLQGGVDKTVSSKHGLALELGGDNDGLECLSTTT